MGIFKRGGSLAPPAKGATWLLTCISWIACNHNGKADVVRNLGQTIAWYMALADAAEIQMLWLS